MQGLSEEGLRQKKARMGSGKSRIWPTASDRESPPPLGLSLLMARMSILVSMLFQACQADVCPGLGNSVSS